MLWRFLLPSSHSHRLSLLPAAPGQGCRAADTLQEWIDRHMPAEPVEAALCLAHQLRLRLEQDLDPAARMAVLGTAFDRLDDLLHPIETSLTNISLPLDSATQRKVLAASRLLKRLAVAYGLLVDAAEQRWLTLGFAPFLRLAALRQLQALARRQALAYRIYAPGPRGAWLRIHALYRSSRERNFATMSLDGDGTRLEQIYVDALLLALAEPARLQPSQLAEAQDYIRRYGDHALLKDASAGASCRSLAPGCFLIRAGLDAPAYPLSGKRSTRLTTSDQILDCRPLLDLMAGQVKSLEEGSRVSAIGLPRSATQPFYPELLKRLAERWWSQPNRRHLRMRFLPRARVIAGFHPVWEQLGRRRSGVSAPSLVGEAEWSISNESADGFGLRMMGSASPTVHVGEILCVQPRNQDKVHLGIARRARAMSATTLEIGVQVLAPAPQSIKVYSAHRVAVGKAEDGAATRGILLAHVPSRQGKPALLLPFGQLRAGQRVVVTGSDQAGMWQLGEVLEHNHTWELFAATPVDCQPVSPWGLAR